MLRQETRLKQVSVKIHVLFVTYGTTCREMLYATSDHKSIKISKGVAELTESNRKKPDFSRIKHLQNIQKIPVHLNSPSYLTDLEKILEKWKKIISSQASGVKTTFLFFSFMFFYYYFRKFCSYFVALFNFILSY